MQIACNAFTITDQCKIAAKFMTSRVVDGDAGCGCKRSGEPLVLLGKGATVALLGEVDLPELLTTHQDRCTEKGLHHRVAVWESDRCRMRADVIEAEDFRMCKQMPEQAQPFWEAFDLVGLFVRDS